jgi:pilus assembly protein CpaB
MKKAQVAVLGVALLSGAAAFWLMSGAKPQEPERVVLAAPAAPLPQTTSVLVARVDLEVGRLTRADDFRWQEWPIDSAPPTSFRKSQGIETPPEEVVGSIVRSSIVANEPILKEKLIKTQGSGFMSALLPGGYRAVAINIDASGSSAAGGFILPNDRVDVIRVYRDELESRLRGGETYASETILQNVRVLAIGQALNDRAQTGVAVGSTNATLELTPRQAEQVVVAQRSGGGVLTLVLRSALDQKRKDGEEDGDDAERSLTVVRFGQSMSR